MASRRHRPNLTPVSSLWLLPLLVIWATLSSASDVTYQIKASYIYNILQFVQFPAPALTPDGEVRVCILGQNHFGAALDELKGATTPQGKILIRHLGSRADADALNRCNLIYFDRASRGHHHHVLSRIATDRVLTVGEFESFIASGGLIELYEENDHIRFKINPSQVNQTEFKLDAQLIQLGVPEHATAP